ncbi:T9SS type A sorting domain-containing protein [Hymenobacter sp.]|uniref:T9SS type A sorting domain-containing protein n=1 Tax=Hymenobacter sp. TaxID=1898978 RepID=UPI002ED9351D
MDRKSTSLFTFHLFRLAAIYVLVLLFLPVVGQGQNNITYTWTGGGTNSNWSNALNWTPARALPATTDVLVFDPSALLTATSPVVSVTIDFTTQTVAQLRFLNGVSVVFSSSIASGSTLALSGSLAGAEFEVSGVNAGGTPTSVQFAGANPLTVTLAANNQGRITGNLGFAGGVHRLVATSFETVEFASGSLFTAGANFAGNAFGTGTINSVIFRSGSTYAQQSGASPFGDATSSVARFDSGSRFIAGASTVAVNNRTYGILEFATNNITGTGTGELTVLNDLVVTSGAINLNVASIVLRGNLTVNGGSIALNGTTSLIKFEGTSVQSINGTGGSVAIDRVVEISNATSVRLARPVRVVGGLTLTNGALTTTSTNSLTLAPTAVITGGSSSSFVNGPLTREVNAAVPIVFPIGKGTAYRPLTLNISALGTGATTYTAEQVNGRLVAQTFSGNIKRVSRVRYYTLTPNAAPTGFSGQITLSFGPDDEVTDPRTASFVIGKSNGSVWENIGHSANTGVPMNGAFVAGTLTSAPFTSFSDFVLASTDPDPALNPLPVTLTGFTAKPNTDGVLLHWTTASEQANEGFEVQRSTNGQHFTTLATVEGQGQSTGARHYTHLDSQPLAGLSYYRLRQLDHDDKDSFSPVVAVSSKQVLILYPNPVQTILQLVTSTKDARYRVLNMLGELILEGVASTGSTTLSVANLPLGLYQIEVISSGVRSIRKFVKE